MASASELLIPYGINLAHFGTSLSFLIISCTNFLFIPNWFQNNLMSQYYTHKGRRHDIVLDSGTSIGLIYYWSAEKYSQSARYCSIIVAESLIRGFIWNQRNLFLFLYSITMCWSYFFLVSSLVIVLPKKIALFSLNLEFHLDSATNMVLSYSNCFLFVFPYHENTECQKVVFS